MKSVFYENDLECPGCGVALRKNGYGTDKGKKIGSAKSYPYDFVFECKCCGARMCMTGGGTFELYTGKVKKGC